MDERTESRAAQRRSQRAEIERLEADLQQARKDLAELQRNSAPAIQACLDVARDVYPHADPEGRALLRGLFSRFGIRVRENPATGLLVVRGGVARGHA